MEQKTMQKQLAEKAEQIIDQAGRSVWVIRDDAVMGIVDRFGVTMRNVYLEALKAGIRPCRYLRNGESISLEEQLRLAESNVAVIGAGGLGGHVIILLVRAGIGCLTVVDHDCFDESNLNRQALCTQKSLGKSKAEEAALVAASINPAVEVRTFKTRLNNANAVDILASCHVAVDALDNIPDRFVLEDAARKMKISLVHGAVAGFTGQLLTINPDSPGLQQLFGEDLSLQSNARKPETILGVPGIAPAVIGALQAMEVIKILLGRGQNKTGDMLHLDLEQGRFKRYTIS